MTSSCGSPSGSDAIALSSTTKTIIDTAVETITPPEAFRRVERGASTLQYARPLTRGATNGSRSPAEPAASRRARDTYAASAAFRSRYACQTRRHSTAVIAQENRPRLSAVTPEPTMLTPTRVSE
jgi:hypothetical protein